MSRFLPVLLIAILPASLSAQFGGDFEAPCPTGPAAVTGCPPELWTTQAGGASALTTVFVEPDGASIPGPVGGFPTMGMQWAIVSATNGDGSLTPPPAGGPAPYPLASGATGNLIFANVPIPPAITFDWNYVLPECVNDGTYNDFLTVDIVDPTTGMPLANILYRDTFSTTYSANAAVTPDETGTVPVGYCVPTLEEMPLGTAKTVTFAVPASLVGTTANIEFHVGNATDNGYSGYLYVDNIVLIGGGVADYQLNQTEATALINGVVGVATAPTVVTVAVGATAIGSLSSTLLGNPWDVGTTVSPLVPGSAGGIVLSDGQRVNLNIADPSFSGLFPTLFGGPGFTNFPGVPLLTAVPLTTSVQLAVTDPGVPSGVRMSQATQMVVQ